VAGLTEQEDFLLECLNVAVKAGDAPEKRRRKAMDTASWDLLEKKWKGLLLIALNKEEISNKDSSSQRNRRTRGRGRRVRKSSAEDWVEGIKELISSDESPGYRLSAMLVQRDRLGAGWNATWDSELEKMRNSCVEGIHPVWARLGMEAPLLAEMQSYPEVRVAEKKVGNTTDWIAAARIDPLKRESLSKWLGMKIPHPLTANLQLSVQRVNKSLKGKGKLTEIPADFSDFEGDCVLIRALVGIHVNDGRCSEDLLTLIETGGPLATIAKDQLALVNLRAGDFQSWKDCHQVQGDDALSVVMRRQSWITLPEDTGLSAEEIETGVQLIGVGEGHNTLMWNLVAAHLREGNQEGALQTISELNIVDSKRLQLVLELIESSGDEVLIERLSEDINRIDSVGLELIIQTEGVPLQVRSSAIIEIQDRGDYGSEHFQEIALNVFTDSGDAVRIGLILMKMEDGATMHPHRTLLVHHLLPGNADKELCKWVLNARPRAIEALANEHSGVLSETAIGLVKLLEGAPADLAAIQSRIGGNREAIRAFNQCRQAMLKGGDGLVQADRLDKLQSSISNSSLSGVELRLFSAVLDQLRFNRAIRLLEDHRIQSTSSAISTLDSLVGANPRKQIVDVVRQVVLEHDSIAIPSFAEWHRRHAGSSAWNKIIFASIEEKAEKYESAGRYLRDASQDNSFEFENRVRLGRRALIAFAHAGKYSMAVEMLNAQPALQSAITGIFQLYLHVCADAVQQQPESARRRLLDWISNTEVVSEENAEGEEIKRERTTYPSDELDLLFTYPNTRGLPKDLWQGRVRATKRSLSSDRRSQRSRLEDRFQGILDDKAGVEEIEAVAREAAELNPTQGLMMFERAMNSGQFSVSQMKALLRIQNGIFRLNESSLPIRVRRKLRHLTLKPLVLVDTNLLIDAAKDRIGLLLDQEGGIETDVRGSFHRTILYKSTAGMIELSVPPAAENEFKKMMGNIERVRTLFDDMWMNEIEWVEKVTRSAVEKVCNEVLSDFNTWKPGPASQSDDYISEFEEKTVAFMVEHRKTYLEIVDSNYSTKVLSKRTKIGKDAIYPERGDRDIMREAAMVANSMHKGIGAVLVATRDSDFWIVRRSLEETFGFGVVRTARELSQWA